MTIRAKENVFDKVVGYFSPARAATRLAARASYNTLSNFALGGHTGYKVPGQRSRTMRGWDATRNSADGDVLTALPASRAGARDLFMNTPLAAGLLRRIKTNVVGPGLFFRAAPDREFLGLEDDAAERWERHTEREFALWSESKDCDINRTHDFQEFQGLAFLSILMNGDVFVTMPYKSVGDSPYKLKLKLIEGDQCCNPNGQGDTYNVAGGVEVDEDGTPVKYYFSKYHPGNFGNNLGADEWIEVPAFGAKTQRRNVLHLMFKERVGQRRGMPILANVMELLKQLSRLSESELDKSVVHSLLTAFITTTAPDAGPLDDALSKGDGSGDGKETLRDPIHNPEDTQTVELGKGTVVTLQPGETVTPVQATSPNPNFEAFFNTMVKQLGSSSGVPFELIMLHFESTFTAYRGEILEAWRWFKELRVFLAKNLNQPVYEEFLWEAVLSGRIVAPGFITDPAVRKAWGGAYWGGAGMGQVDPLKETQAAVLRANNNLSTWTDEKAAIDGGDWEGVVLRRARENKLMKSKDVMPPIPQSMGAPGPAPDNTDAGSGAEPDGKKKPKP